jgi:hypothetical protein
MPPVTRMTSNRARHELIRLPAISDGAKVRPGGCSAHGPVTPRPTIGDRPSPGDGPRFVRGQGRSPVPVPPICRGRPRRGRSPVRVPDSDSDSDSHRGVRALVPGQSSSAEAASAAPRQTRTSTGPQAARAQGARRRALGTEVQVGRPAAAASSSVALPVKVVPLWRTALLSGRGAPLTE